MSYRNTKKKSNRKKKIIYFLIIIFTFLAIDFFSKFFLYDHNWWLKHKDNNFESSYQYKNSLFEVKSFPNYKIFFFVWANWQPTMMVYLLICLTLIFLFLILAFLSKRTFTKIILGFFLIGFIGDITDIAWTNGEYLRQFLYFPKISNSLSTGEYYAIFNVGNIFLAIGWIFLCIKILWFVIKLFKK